MGVPKFGNPTAKQLGQNTGQGVRTNTQASSANPVLDPRRFTPASSPRAAILPEVQYTDMQHEMEHGNNQQMHLKVSKWDLNKWAAQH